MATTWKKPAYRANGLGWWTFVGWRKVVKPILHFKLPIELELQHWLTPSIFDPMCLQVISIPSGEAIDWDSEWRDLLAARRQTLHRTFQFSKDQL